MNKIKTVDLYELVESSPSIPYIKALKALRLVKGIGTCLLMAQFEQYFAENPDGFYKYIAKPDLQESVDGLDWTTELAMTYEEYRGALKKIGICYKSKQHYLDA